MLETLKNPPSLSMHVRPARSFFSLGPGSEDALGLYPKT